MYMIYNKDNNYNNDHSNNLKTQKNMCFLFTKKRKRSWKLFHAKTFLWHTLSDILHSIHEAKIPGMGINIKGLKRGLIFQKLRNAGKKFKKVLFIETNNFRYFSWIKEVMKMRFSFPNTSTTLEKSTNWLQQIISIHVNQWKWFWLYIKVIKTKTIKQKLKQKKIKGKNRTLT